MRDVSKKCCNLTFGIVILSNLAKLRIKIEGTEKRISCVEALPGTISPGLIDYSVEEFRCNNISHRNIIVTRRARGTRCRGTRSLLTSLATIIITGATEAILTTAQVGSTTTILRHYQLRHGYSQHHSQHDG
ncbi:hypothetical protein NC653_041693 [Populus alba x Populus x berolinensis]|uniref:Uncharacterized protein n=1 Tax=Populus alba x Populus x berolinensis TaxID=444605 RepID=A0AAD6PPK7_9ROSI|nr:hypothetical protein NC653_041693 [Populus alba x Populus x berolinensis]